MRTSGAPADVARQLQQMAAELDRVAERMRAAGNRAQRAFGATATGADRQMLAGLDQASSSARGAQQALSAAATALRRLPARTARAR